MSKQTDPAVSPTLPATGYPASMRALHWLMALLVLSQFGVGMAMSGEDDEIMTGLFGWHTSLGLLILVLAIARVANRLRSEVPALPPTMPAWERTAARVAHVALYVLLVAVPVLGYVAAGADPESTGVKIFGVALPAPVENSAAVAEAAGEIHESLVWTLAGVLMVHVGAVFKHAFFDRPEHDVLRRMI